jgi:Caspase domain
MQGVEGESGKKKAIIVGINNYEVGPENIPNLAGAENDAVEIHKSLTTISGFEVLPDHFLLGGYATHKAIRKTVSDLFRKNTDNATDLIVFYFSGHGYVDENKEGYLAPYDMDPGDPDFCGIKMGDLRNTIFGSKNKANVVMILDCCYAGIATKGTKAAPAAETKNLYAFQVNKLVESPDFGNSGMGRLILASSEANGVSREKADCQHHINPERHIHGTFSFHLVEGLEGKAADPRTGIITFESLRKYLENQMLAEGKQRPLYFAEQSSLLDNLKIGVSLTEFNNNIAELIGKADKFCRMNDIQALTLASKTVGDLAGLDQNNREIPRLIQSINDALQNIQKQSPIIDWLNSLASVRLGIEQIRPGLYDEIFYSLADSLSYDQLQKIDMTNLQYLIILCNESKKNTTYESENDAAFKRLIARLQSISHPSAGPR